MQLLRVTDSPRTLSHVTVVEQQQQQQQLQQRQHSS
jgi:hypothetical protein